MKRTFFNRIIPFFSICICLTLLFFGCSDSRKRPFGYLRLGPVQQFLQPVTYLPEYRLLIRHDDSGLSVMSTMCTYDLTPLRKEETANGTIFRSEYSKSIYNQKGSVISGPTKERLPFYRLIIASGNFEKLGEPDTLFVYVGDERPPQWRLPVPKKFYKLNPVDVKKSKLSKNQPNGTEFLSILVTPAW